MKQTKCDTCAKICDELEKITLSGYAGNKGQQVTSQDFIEMDFCSKTCMVTFILKDDQILSIVTAVQLAKLEEMKKAQEAKTDG